MENKFAYLDQNIESIRSSISEAARSVGRDPSDITLCIAVKSGEIDEINYLLEKHSVKAIGENRVQQMMERCESLRLCGAMVCFIGSLQTNKVKYLIDKVDLIESVDSLRLAAEIDRQARAHDRVMDILIEINSGGEEQKGGVGFDELYELCLAVSKMENLRICGFMTMAPRCESADEYRTYFSRTREAALSVWSRLGTDGSPILSMGMTDSYVEAILEGATHVRVGRGAFAK